MISDLLPIVLVGMPGSGKSKVGRALAQHLGVPHVDTDQEVERQMGTSISAIFVNQGEAEFRRLEAEAVRTCVKQQAVVSLGGGAVTSLAVREMLAGHTVVFIDVSLEELVRRTSGKTHRPLLADNPVHTLQQLLDQREHWYRQVSTLVVQSGEQPVDTVVDQIVEALDHQPTQISVGGAQPYQVHIGLGAVHRLEHLPIRSDATKALIIAAPTVSPIVERVSAGLQALGLETRVMVTPDAEASKTLAVASKGWDVCGQMQLGRHDLIVGVGGGATTDLAGFVAASWLRGVDVVQVPTTVLGMVDAAVGGKTGINTTAGKNLVGAFHTPVAVVEDLRALVSLPPADMRAGLGEAAKCGFIADQEILQLLQEAPDLANTVYSPQLHQVIRRSVDVKARVVTQDVAELGLREVLNYGHTLAHAIELVEDFTWRHGEAVAVGCVFAAELAHSLGLLTSQEVQRHREVFASLGLPISYHGAPLDALVHAMFSDKKVRGGILRFVLLDGIGHPVVRRVDVEQLVEPAVKVGIDVTV